MRTEDGCIIHECLDGKPEAFGILVDKYKEGIYAYVYAQLRDFRDAQDVTQEVFERAYRNLHGLRRWESFSFWIYRIAHRCCVQWFRVRLRRVDGEFIEDQDPRAIDATSLDSYHENQLSQSVQEALDSLPEAYREVLLLHYFGGMTSKDIAEAIGISPMAVLKRLSRGRAQLKEEMIAVMGAAFEQQRLRTGFTFRIVEAVKRIKIHPMPRMAGLPWGLSIVAGIIITVMSLNPHISITSKMTVLASSMVPAEMKVLKDGEIPVDILKTDEIPVIYGKQDKGKDGEPGLTDVQDAFFLAPQGRGDTWTKKADLPIAVRNLPSSSPVVNGKPYVIGGLGKGGDLSSVYEYDPMADEWVKKADMPTKRANLYTCAANGKIYAIGGGWDGSAISTVEEYDPVTNTWTKKADMPTARCFLSGGVVDGKIYAIGGMQERESVLSTVEEYDPVADKWTRRADMPTKRAFFAAVAVNGKIYAIAGQDFDVNIEAWLQFSTVEEYDPKVDKWVKKDDIPTIRVCLTACAVNRRIYAIGGRSNTWVEVEEYDPVIDTWTQKADMPTARWELSSSAVNGRIYAIGGCSPLNDMLSTVEEYDTGFEDQNIETAGKLPTKWGEVKSD